MRTEIKEIIDQLNQVYSGDPWYGDGFVEKLSKIDWRIVNKMPTPNSPSVARLVKHILNWRVFLIQKLNGNVDFDIITDAPNDWTDIIIETEKDWTRLLEEMSNVHNETIELLTQNTKSKLQEKVTRRSYNFEFLLKGIVQHDIYHIGQIGLIAKQVSVVE